MGKFPGGKKFSRDGAQHSYGGGERRQYDGGRGAPQRGGFAPRREDDRPMHRAVCSMCQKDCEVPFRPTGDRPVFCQDCFRKERESGFSATQNDRRTNDRSDSYRPAPTQAPRNDVVAHDQYKARFEQLNIKLDKILHLLEVTVMEAPKPTTTPAPSQHGLHTATTARPVKVAKQVVDTKALGKVVAKAVAGTKPTSKPTTTKVVAKKPASKVAPKTTVAKKTIAKKGK